MSEPSEIRYCRQCEKELHGRSDQVYCNDTCRNGFNKAKAKKDRLEPHPLQKAIFKIIKRNYDIMRRAYSYPIRPERYEFILVHKMDKDFNPIFLPGSIKTKPVYGMYASIVVGKSSENVTTSKIFLKKPGLGKRTLS